MRSRRHSVAHHLLAEPVVAHERHAPVLAQRRACPACRCRAGARRSAAPVRGVSSSASGSSSTARRRGPVAESPQRLQLDQPLQHLDRVAVDVEVVEVALLHVVQLGDLRQHGRAAARAGRPARARRARRRSEHQPAQLGEHALAGRLRHPRRGRAREALGLAVGREARARPPGGPAAAGAEGRLVGARRRARAACRASRSARAAVRVDQLAARERAGHRVDREVALGQVLLDRLRPAAATRRRRGPPARSIARQAPKASESRNTGPPQAIGHGARAAASGSPATATSTSRDAPAEQLVAHRAADDPGVGVTGSARGAPAAERPQVIS